MAMSGRFWKIRSSYRRSRQQTSKLGKCGESLRQCGGNGRVGRVGPSAGSFSLASGEYGWPIWCFYVNVPLVMHGSFHADAVPSIRLATAAPSLSARNFAHMIQDVPPSKWPLGEAAVSAGDHPLGTYQTARA